MMTSRCYNGCWQELCHQTCLTHPPGRLLNETIHCQKRLHHTRALPQFRVGYADGSNPSLHLWPSSIVASRVVSVCVVIQLHSIVSFADACHSLPTFLFFSPFLKFFHKYAPGGMISKSRPLARRHRWWRRVYTSRRYRFWGLGLRLDADVAVTWQAARHRRSQSRAWRHRSWR